MVRLLRHSRGKRLVLLDSHALIHRAYHALPDFTSSKGEPTGALYGLVTMIFKIAEELRPDYLIAARDLPGGTHRHQMFEAYKGTRVQAEDTLIAQLKRAPEVFAAFGIPVYAAQGYEADDVLGTIVQQLRDRDNIETIIATGDLDTLQLVSDSVYVYTLRKGLQDTVLYDEDAVIERYGFGPEHVVDYKALRGDPSDNIPGVKGIGEKTATELIQLFGSVEEIYKTLEEKPTVFAKKIKPRVAELLRTGKESAFLSKQLATIHDGAPIDFVMPEVDWKLPDHAETIYTLCDELDFRSLKDRVRAISKVQKEDESMKESQMDGLFPELEEPIITIDPERFAEVAIALWLIHSDLTNPTYTDIVDFAHEKDFEKARDVVFTKMRETGRLGEVYDQIEHPLISIVDRMNVTGVQIDVGYLRDLSREYTKELDAIAARIYRHAGHEFNINSPKQLAVVLFDELAISTGKQKKTANGGRTTREEELAKLAEVHPIIPDILAHRELQKLLSTYIDKIPLMVKEDGRLHAQFLQAGTTTGRMASQTPNLQNIPIKTEYGKRIRKAFVAPSGKVLAAIDYSQIELRIAAGLSGDEKLIHVFQSGGDVHTAVAAEVFGVAPGQVDREMRRRAKVINFGILYGMGVLALKTNLGAGVSREEASLFLSNYFKKFEGLARYIAEVKENAARMGYTETLFGRRRYFPGFKSALPALRAQAERMATNAPLQGTQADIIKLAMIRVDELLATQGKKDSARLLMQVHDELIYEIDERDAEATAREIAHIMETVVAPKELKGVPIVAEVSIGKNWGELTRLAK